MNGSSLLRLLVEAAEDDEGEEHDETDADDDAELLGRDREDEVGMRVGKDALDPPSPGPAPNQPP